jgi:hypothetical protein
MTSVLRFKMTTSVLCLPDVSSAWNPSCCLVLSSSAKQATGIRADAHHTDIVAPNVDEATRQEELRGGSYAARHDGIMGVKRRVRQNDDQVLFDVFGGMLLSQSAPFLFATACSVCCCTTAVSVWFGWNENQKYID